MDHKIHTHCAEEIEDASQAHHNNLKRIMEALSQLKDLGFTLLSKKKKIRKLRGKLHELRISMPDGIGRILFFVGPDSLAHCVRFFVKKSEQTPPKEIELAISRMKALTS